MRRKTTNKKVGNLIGYIVLILCVAVLIGGVVMLSREGGDTYKSFSVSYGDELVEDGTEVTLDVGGKLRFACAYEYGKLTLNQSDEYTVRVLPNVSNDNDFDYVLDGVAYFPYSGEPDLTSGFTLVYGDGYFELSTNKDMREILQTIHPNRPLDLPLTDYGVVSYFTILVTAYDGLTSYRIDLIYDATVTSEIWTPAPGNDPPTGITLDQTEVIL